MLVKKIKAAVTYSDLQEVYNELKETQRFRHKKGDWTIKKFSVSFNKESEVPNKTIVHYWNKNRRYDVKICNLHKHFEIIDIREDE
ncbi:hypothetical protein [Priestia megaterium]|uniref:hypothetical protein n=1 Tax=Priestia megaterium TaxID=1404 RepID=UPI00211B84AF|nr:hypothetical protein [Priestia megaterium]